MVGTSEIHLKVQCVGFSDIKWWCCRLLPLPLTLPHEEKLQRAVDIKV